MICLVDADLLIYIIGFATEHSRFDQAKRQVDNRIESILERYNTNQYKLYLSDSEGNFRKEIDQNYKANRKSEKPKHYVGITNYMLSEWDAEVAWEQEADDAMGIYQSNHKDTVICTTDKDLDQIPGLHYNFQKDKEHNIAPEDGLRFFYQQVLSGDAVDNIPGLKGIGGVKAALILKGCTGEQEMFQASYRAYNRVYKDVLEAESKLLQSGRLVKIRQKPGELWSFPNAS